MVSKAVIPAAGLGTRFLPATKAVPKELLPLVDKPALEYIVEEAARVGLTDILMITGRSKTAIEDHFDRVPEIEAALEKKGDADRLARVQASSELAQMHFVRQGEAKGLGHAVLVAAPHVGNEPFAVLLGDDVVDERDPLLATMIAEQQAHGGSVIALMEVEPEWVSSYGVATVEDAESHGPYAVKRVRDLVEKPPPEEAPSNLAVIGRYVLSPTIFEVLRNTPPGRGGEIQLTDAIKTLAESEPVHGVVFDGRRYDTGDRGDYLKAIVKIACEREDLGPDFWAWLQEYVAAGGPASTR
ncbi:MAG: UTP--glucose-phosphate uridylyltransferase [Frankiaceae bacterium]|nr:UTP--glucose-phosphate uridylyltransferase [Frankiaceae bacterium]